MVQSAKIIMSKIVSKDLLCSKSTNTLCYGTRCSEWNVICKIL